MSNRIINSYESARLLAGYDRETACKMLGVSISYLEKIEYNLRQPGREVLKRMSKVYKKSMDELCAAC